MSLQIKTWAFRRPQFDAGHGTHLFVSSEELPTAMAHSNATGIGLVTNGALGADLIRVAAGDGFVPHTHPGDHILIVVAGEGTITYDGKIYPTEAGQIYMIEGSVPHAVGAITDHTIIAIGSPHKAVDDTERMTPVEYEEITTEFNSLHCLICDLSSTKYLHDLDCPHCPCKDCCNTTGSHAGH